MSNLQIYVDVVNNSTISGFGVGQEQKVFFKNKHQTDTLTVTIDGATSTNSPLCKDGNKVTTFTVPPRTKVGYSICSDYVGDRFKYTAQIGNSTQEDPIVIIE